MTMSLLEYRTTLITRIKIQGNMAIILFLDDNRYMCIHLKYKIQVFVFS